MKKTKLRNTIAVVGLVFFMMPWPSYALTAAKSSDLEEAIRGSQWNEAAQIAHDLLAKDPALADARVKGAYALFQNNFPNAALLLLSKIKPAEWKRIPQGPDRFVEVVALFQKKVPLNLLASRLEQINAEDASPYLLNEIQFAKGREAFENGDKALAAKLLGSVTQQSRLFAQARYLLGTLAIRAGDYKTAAAEFSKVFLPSVFEQSTEIWRDMSAQMTSHWGTNLKVRIDADLIAENTKAGELAVLGLGRIKYAEKNFVSAMEYYSKLTPASSFYSRATLEKIWTMLALGQHEEAQKAAGALSVVDTSFEALEARTVRALVLVDAGRTQEARVELDEFNKVYATTRRALADYDISQAIGTLPAFLQTDLAQDVRAQTLIKYQNELKTEIKTLRDEDHGMFPAFSSFSTGLEPLIKQSNAMVGKFVQEHVMKRRRDLDRLFLQCRLIRIETYLEDREHLRAEFRNMTEVSEAKQLEHDERLAELLGRTVKEVDDILNSKLTANPKLEFRQSELLWELGTATSVLSQVKADDKKQVVADALKDRSLKIARHIVKDYTAFDKRAQAMFFVGFALSSLGRTSESVAALDQYVTQFPKHAHAPDAYRILADVRFDMNDFAGALKYYEKVLEFQDSPIVGYALYKIGWCAYNLKDFARSMLGLEKAVVWANKSSKEGQLLSLRREAQHDLITLYAEVGDHHKAHDYFSQFLHEDSGEWLAQLARELDRSGQFEKSGDLYKQLITMNPAGKENVLYQASILKGFHQLHRWPSVIEAARQLVSRYRGDLGAGQPAESPAAIAEAIMRDAVLAQHFEYRKRPSPESAADVTALDEVYLSAFQTWPSAAEPMYRHAHLLLEQHKNAAAAAMFQTHWVQFKADLKEPLREEALRNLIHALDEEEIAKKTTAMTLSESAQRAIEFSTEYEKLYPNSSHARAIEFLRPVLYFKYGQAAEAIKESQHLFDQNAADDIGKRCFKNLRVAYYDRKNWEETHNWATELLARKNPGMREYADDLKAVREESLFLWAENTADNARSAELFQKIAQDPDMRRLREKSLFNAYQRVQKNGQKIKAIEIADELERTAPGFENLKAIAGVRAAQYEEAGDYARAWPLLEKFLAHPDPSIDQETVRQAHLNCGLMAEALGHTEAATTHFKEYLKKATSKNAGADEANRALARMRKSGERPAEASFPRWSALLKQKADFEARPMPPNADLGVRIKSGANALEAVSKSFLDAATSSATPTSYAFEAYCAVPLLYESYAHAVLGLANAKGLKPQEAQELRGELAKITAPVEVKAKELATECIAKGGEAEHDGSYYKTVIARWGWLTDAALKSKSIEIVHQLSQRSPWFDVVKGQNTNETEEQLLKRHHEDKGDDESWYALARLRWIAKQPGLSRLTIVDALGRKPSSPKLLNAFAMIESAQHERVRPLLEKAGEAGSSAAWANLALYHLQASRLPQAVSALNHCLDSDTFEAAPELKSLVKEFLKK